MKRLFLYGDSISMQYQPYLEALLQSHFTIERKGDGMPLDDLSDMRVNGGDSRMMASYFEKTDIRADILLFNAGLHDSRIFPNGQRQVPLVEYALNIFKTIHLARAKWLFPVFITTTLLISMRMRTAAICSTGAMKKFKITIRLRLQYAVPFGFRLSSLENLQRALRRIIISTTFIFRGQAC